MDDLNNIKEMINIPEGIDLAVKKGFERGKKEKKRRKHKKIYKRVGAIAATLALVVIVGINNPEIVQAIPGVGSIFKLIDYDRMGRNLSAYEKFATSINKSVENNGIKVTIDEIAIDDNSMVITSTIEGEGIKEGKGTMERIELNGIEIGNHDGKDKLISDKKLVSVITANVSDITLGSNIEVNIKMLWIGDVKGPWEFKFNVAKANNIGNSRSINLNKSIKMPNSTLTLDKLTISPLGNTINYSGKYDSTNEDKRNGVCSFIVMDENGKILDAGETGGGSSNEKYEGKIEIIDDLSDVNSITVVPVFKEWGAKKEDVYYYFRSILQTTINNNHNSNQELITIKRPATKEEKAKGYVPNEAVYLYNIDNERIFLPLNELINQTIKVSDNNSVTIKNIEATDKYTKLTFKLDGNGAYYYYNINETVILDEDYKDTERAEDGELAVMENQAEKIVSIKLPAVDKNKKYKIAIPMITEPEIDDRYKINIDLNK